MSISPNYNTDFEYEKQGKQVLTCAQLGLAPLQQLLSRFGLTVVEVDKHFDIPGSYWGAPEAGIIGHILYVQEDTPIHSALHEACHYICLDEARRNGLHTDAGGDYDEENGVCYLQILLSDFLPAMGRVRMWQDMDAWGYTFRLGSTQAWFEKDAEDARQWLIHYCIIDINEQPTWSVRK